MLNLRAFALLLVVLLAACGGAAAPSPTPGVTPTPRPTPTAVPGASNLPTSGGGSGESDPGTGSFPDPNGCCDGGLIGNLFPDDPNGNPLFGDATYLTPAKGLLNPRPMNAQLVRAAIGPDGNALVDLRWWSGVAPCNQLDHVEIFKDGAAKTVRLAVIEGSGPGDMMCIEIAELHGTLVDVGKLASGKWTISAQGDAPTIPLDVP